MSMQSTSNPGTNPQAMDVQAVPKEKPRRVIVDYQNPNQEIIDSKKPQVPQDKPKKSKVMRFIATTHLLIIRKFYTEPDYMDLDIGNQIHNISFTSYTILRQRYNSTGGTLENRIATTDFKITDGQERTVPKDVILKLMLENANNNGIPFGKYGQDDPENWYGIANPIYNFLSGFALRKKELRLGHGLMPIEKRDNQEKSVQIAQYGVYGVHHVLCEGISFPPEKRASMPQTVGPITALLCYIKSDRRYSKKWADAVKRAFAHFPDIDGVIQMLKEKEPSEIRNLITLMADLALIATTRQANRMFPPPAAFAYIFGTKDFKIGNDVYNVTSLYEVFNFSGQGAFLFYKIFMSLKWRMRLMDGTDTIAKQICYHAMFGTFKEDFGILSQITNVANWLTREEMGSVFKSTNTKGIKMDFIPVQQLYYSKLAQANQSGLLTNTQAQICSQPVFSGYTKRKFDEAFFEYYESNTSKSSGGRSIQTMIANYMSMKEELKKNLEKNNRVLNMGTTSWYDIGNTNLKDIAVPIEGLVFSTSGRFFLGRK
uniref:Nucleoprotein n=1 Tax=Hymenopteran orthomyxo-related virus OKIAV175 TaxID=2792559 RepID=A0A7T0M3K9_9ORTO|nr:nucleoprotein [Hymenopteran orthomyxo-related virus OKIAV175]